MIDALVWEFEERSDSIFIHFDVSDHFLSLDTFVRTAESAKNIIEALDQTFFDRRLDYELIVLPHQEGSFLAKLGLLVAAPAAVFAFINTDVGGAYVEGLTGRSPSDWARSFGEAHRALIDEQLENAEGIIEADEDEEPLQFEDGQTSKVASQILVAMTRGVLEKSSEELDQIGMEIGALPDAIDARADFYAACIDDCDVRRVGFSPSDDFPIPRNSFPERARKPARVPKGGDAPEWFLSVDTIYVTSPNWDRDDQRARQWKGKYQNGRDCYFVIEDAEFWLKVSSKNIQPEVLHKLKVQWCFNVIGDRPKNRRVLRVLEFNGEKLADPLAPEAIRAILGQYSEGEFYRESRTLFD